MYRDITNAIKVRIKIMADGPLPGLLPPFSRVHPSGAKEDFKKNRASFVIVPPTTPAPSSTRSAARLQRGRAARWVRRSKRGPEGFGATLRAPCGVPGERIPRIQQPRTKRSTQLGCLWNMLNRKIQPQLPGTPSSFLGPVGWQGLAGATCCQSTFLRRKGNGGTLRPAVPGRRFLPLRLPSRWSFGRPTWHAEKCR